MKGRNLGRIQRVTEAVKEQIAAQKLVKQTRLVSFKEKLATFIQFLGFSYFCKSTFLMNCLLFTDVLRTERIASPVPSNADNSDAMTMTATSNVTIAFSNAITSNQTNSSASKAKIPPLKLRTSMDCDNSSVTGEPSSAELVVRIFFAI